MPLILALVPLAFFRVAGFLGCPASHSARKPRNDSRGSGIAIMSFQTALKRLRAIAPPPKTGKDFLQLFLALATCFLAGILGLKLTILNPPVSPVWPPAGVGLAAMLLLGYRVWPAIFIASFFVCEVAATPLHASAAISVANTLEAFVAAYLVNRFARGIKAFETAQSVFKFILAACVLSPTVGATICFAYLYPAGVPQGPDKGIMWLTWCMGDGIGILLFAPFLILIFGSPHHRLSKGEALELSAMTIGLIVVCLTVFGPFSAFVHEKQLLQEWVCVPFLVWAGFRFCQLEAAGTTLLMFGLAIWGTFHGYGPFVSPDSNLSMMILAAFVGVTGTATLAIAATLSERRHLEEGLLGLQSILHATVDGKTRALSNLRRLYPMSFGLWTSQICACCTSARPTRLSGDALAALYTPTPTPGSMPFIPMITIVRSPFSTRKPWRPATTRNTASCGPTAKFVISGTAAISSAMKMDGLRASPASPAISPSSNASRKSFSKPKNPGKRD